MTAFITPKSEDTRKIENVFLVTKDDRGDSIIDYMEGKEKKFLVVWGAQNAVISIQP